MKNLKITDDNMYYGNYRAKVLNNNDPLKLGRIKLEVYPMLTGISEDLLPWAVSAMPIYDGAGIGTGYFSVPKVGSMVYCFFENGDIYQPVFFAEAADGKKGLPDSRLTNYPNRKVIRSSSGFEIYLDESDNVLYIYHPSTTDIKIDSDGTITINSAKDVNINVNGNTNVISSGDITISGSSVNINP